MRFVDDTLDVWISKVRLVEREGRRTRRRIVKRDE